MLCYCEGCFSFIFLVVVLFSINMSLTLIIHVYMYMYNFGAYGIHVHVNVYGFTWLWTHTCISPGCLIGYLITIESHCNLLSMHVYIWNFCVLLLQLGIITCISVCNPYATL